MVDAILPEEVYTYWDELDIIVEVEAEIHQKLEKNILRDLIIKAISKGTVDEVAGETKRRHALTVNEMIDIISDMTGEKHNKSNIYYHLQILNDLGITQEVTTIKEGNIVTSYFGRTSKLIMAHLGGVAPNKQEELRKQLEYQPDFKKFLQRMQEKHGTEESIDQLVDDMKQVREKLSDHERGFKEWISSSAPELVGLDLDLIKLFYLYNDLFLGNPFIQDFYSRLDSILQVREEG
jgi:hypothetical protein